MIDISSETVVCFTEAIGHLPQRRKGKRPNVATLYRWAQRGLKGVRLETLQVGGTKCTSLEALQRFFERLTDSKAPAAAGDAARELADAGTVQTEPSRTPARRQRDADRAVRELAEEGL